MKHVDNPFITPSLLSFCPGIRGLERGLERAIGDIRTLAHVEIETFIIENMVRQMEQGLLAPAPIWSNLKTFDAQPFRGKVHGYIGGYPCQPFSNAGNRKGTEDPRHLWPYIQQHISTGRPIWCFFENVAGHLSMGYDEVYRDLRNLGYSVEAGIYSADEVGAPHKRERLFILALDDSYGIRPESFHEVFARWDGVINAGEAKMAYADSNGHDGSENRQGAIEGGNDHSSGTGNVFESTGHGDKSINEGVADTESIGVQGHRGEGEQEPGSHVGETISECHGRRDRWPAGPRGQQHDWEEPRSVKSGLGCTANGYNFREDLLRALGNSVVEQQGEFAFIDLLKKHYGSRTKHAI
jgi:site-specific DNA-cytosine methylase